MKGDYRSLKTKRAEMPFTKWFKKNHRQEWELLLLLNRELDKRKLKTKKWRAIKGELDWLRIKYTTLKEGFMAGQTNPHPKNRGMR